MQGGSFGRSNRHSSEFNEICNRHMKHFVQKGITPQMETAVMEYLAELGVLVMCSVQGRCEGDCPSGQSCIRLHNMNCACSTRFSTVDGAIVPTGHTAAFFDPLSGAWVYSHDAVGYTNRPTDNNNNVGHHSGCPAESTPPGTKFCADVVDITIDVSVNAEPRLRIQPGLTREQMLGRISVVSGPDGWWDIHDGPVYSANSQSITVRIKGWTAPQLFKMSVPVEEYHE